MRLSARPLRTGLIVAFAAAACLVTSAPQPAAAEPTSDNERANLTHQEIELLDSGSPVNVMYDAATGDLISVKSTAN